MKNIYFIVVLFLMSISVSNAQNVSAYQAGAYQAGLLNVRDLSAVGPGLYLLDYNYWNKSTSYYDKDGYQVDGFISDKGHVDLSQQVSGYTNVPVLFYASKFKILGGATYMATIAPTFISSNFRANINYDDDNIEDAVSSSNAGGFADMAVVPLALSWSFGDKMDLAFFYTFYAPTGKYETGESDNVGRGYWTHQLQIPFYYYLQQKTTAFVIVPTYEFNGKIKGSDVKPGSRVTVEYGLSQYITPWLELEVLNGHNWQVDEDKGDGVWWRDTQLDYKDKSSTVSFGVGVWPWEGRLNIRAKYAMDYGVHQRYKSNFLSLSAIFIPNILN